MVPGDAFSFSKLELISNRVANGFVSLGVLPGDRVTLYGTNCRQWIVAYYDIAKIGAVENPISSMLTAGEVRYVVAEQVHGPQLPSRTFDTTIVYPQGPGPFPLIVMFHGSVGSRRNPPCSPGYGLASGTWSRCRPSR